MVQESISVSGHTTLTRIFDFEAERVSEVSETVAQMSNYDKTPIGVAGSGASYSFNEVGQRKIDTMYKVLQELCSQNRAEPFVYGTDVAKKKSPAMKIGQN